MASVREDPRADPTEPAPEPTPDDHMRRLVRQLATAELERAKYLPEAVGLLKKIAEAVCSPAGVPREKSVSRVELEAELAQAKSMIVAEVTKGESLRAQARLVQRIGNFVLSSARQSWHVALALVVTAVLSILGTVLVRDCLPAVRPPVPAAHP